MKYQRNNNTKNVQVLLYCKEKHLFIYVLTVLDQILIDFMYVYLFLLLQCILGLPNLWRIDVMLHYKHYIIDKHLSL